MFGLTAASVGLLAGPAGTAARSDPGPKVVGPLSLSGSPADCASAAGCVLDYVLDPAHTSDPSLSWHAYWAVTPTSARPSSGWCTTQVIEALSWGSPAQLGARPARTYPAELTTKVGPSSVAALDVDASGHATSAARLEQQPRWPNGIVRTTVRPGQLVVDWEGSTTRGVSLTMAAEIANPGSSTPNLQGLNSIGVGVPCAHLAPPGETFLARVLPASISVGQTAWLELRVPSTGKRINAGGSVTEIDGKATVTVAGGPYGGAARTESSVFPGRTSIALRSGASGYLPGRYVITVALHGPSRTQHYHLRMSVR